MDKKHPPLRATLMSMHCPACGGIARIRNSRPASDIVRELYLECTNERCRCAFRALAEATQVLAPSMLPLNEQSSGSRALRRRRTAAAMSPQDANTLESGMDETAQGTCTD